MNEEQNILLIASGWYYGQTDANDGKFEYFSKEYKFHIAIRTNNRKYQRVETGSQTLHGFLQPRWVQKFRLISKMLFLISTAYRFSTAPFESERPKLVVARDPLSSGIVGVAISAILGVPLIVELNGNFANPNVWKTSAGQYRNVRHKVGVLLARFVLRHAAAIKTLYPGQEKELGVGRSVSQTYVFHDFVALAPISSKTTSIKSYLLTMGTPWYIKGFDVLVTAYNNVLAQDPSYPFDLKIVGWIPDCEMRDLERSCDLKHPRITVVPPVPYAEGQKIIAESAALVVASRSEAMGRVLIEAMSYGVLCIAAKVDGVPSYISDGNTGFLFSPESVSELEELLKNAATENFEKLRSRAKRVAREKFNGQEYARHYQKMVSDVLHKGKKS